MVEKSHLRPFSELVFHRYDFSPHLSCISTSGPSSSRARTGLDSPYVVQFHNCRVLAKAEELFTVTILFVFVFVVAVVVEPVCK